jgi:hypothetical protein
MQIKRALRQGTDDYQLFLELRPVEPVSKVSAVTFVEIDTEFQKPS